MALSIDDLKYIYYTQQVGVSGLSIQDLESLYFSGQGIPQRPVGLPADPSAVDVLYTPAPTIGTALFVDPAATHTLYDSATPPIMSKFLPRGATDFALGVAFPDTVMALPTSRFPHLYTSPQGIWSVEFVTDAPEIKLYFKYQAAVARIRIKVNGKRLTDLPQSTGGITLGSRHLMSIDFGSIAVRRICLEFATVPFGGIYVTKPHTLWKPSPYYDRVMVCGDSIAGGSNENVGSGQGTWVARLADMMGWDDIWSDSIGGTGYVTRNPGGSFNNFLDRIEADILNYAPRKIILFGGYNDSGLGDPAAVQAAAISTGKLIQSKVPTAETIMFGPWSPTGPAAGSVTAVNTALKAAADALGYVFCSQLDGSVMKGSVVLSPATGSWITGTGNTSAPAGNGNADVYVGADAIHPNDAGHRYLADRIYRSLLAAGF